MNPRHPDDFSGDFGEDLDEPTHVSEDRRAMLAYNEGEDHPEGWTEPARLPTWPRWRVALSIWLHPFRTADTVAAIVHNMNWTHDSYMRSSGGDIMACPITTDQGLSQAWTWADKILVGMRAIDFGPWWRFGHRDMWRDLTHPGEPAPAGEEDGDDIPF